MQFNINNLEETFNQEKGGYFYPWDKQKQPPTPFLEHKYVANIFDTANFTPLHTFFALYYAVTKNS